MLQNVTIPLAALADYIVPAIVVASVVGSWVHNALKKYGDARKAEMGEGSAELEQMAAQRREQFMEAASHRPEISARPGTGSSPDANLSMADRIARARARAKAQQTQRPSTPADQLQDPRIQQALAQRRAQLRQQQQQQQHAQSQQQAQQQAQRRAQLQAQQRAQQQQAQAHARAQAQARQRGVLLHDPVQAAEQSPRRVRRRVPEQPKTTRRPTPKLITEQPVSGSALIGKLSRDDLRKAIVLNEVLGKPVALRDEDSY